MVVRKNILIENGFTFFWHSTSVFSQWHPSKFEVNGVLFTSAEQFMMFCKAKLFGDEDAAGKIIDLNNKDGSINKLFAEGKVSSSQIVNDRRLRRKWDGSQKEIKRLGREVRNYDDLKWIEYRVPYVARGNFEKFHQNQDLRDILLGTGKTRLTECNPYDKIWSCGVREEDPRAKDPAQWPGLDLLGEIVTDLRSKLGGESHYL